MGKEIDDGGSAFPWTETVGLDPMDSDGGLVYDVRHPGMTLRDWFAGQALAGLVASIEAPEDHARDAYRIAEAMLRVRQAEGDQ